MPNKLMVTVQAAVLVAWVAGAVLGQSSQTIHITDAGVGSPVSLNGVVQFVGRDTTCSVTGHNNADKKVIAIVVQLDITRPDGRHQQIDGILRIPITPNAETVLVDSCHFAIVIPKPAPAKPKAEAKVVFLEYADGSRWGDASRFEEPDPQANSK